MKYINVHDPICDFAGRVLSDRQQNRADKTIYVRDLLIQYVGQLFGAPNKETAIIAFKVGQKLYEATESPVALEDAEFKVLVTALRQPKHGAMFMIPLYKALDEAMEELPSEE